MIKKDKADEAAEKANASEPTEGEPSSEKENLEAPKETEKVELKEPKPKEIASDYLGEPKTEEKVDWKKRYAGSTKEFQTLKTESDRHQTALTNLENLARLNPKIADEIEAAQRMTGQANQGLPTRGASVQQQVDEALEPVKKVAQDLQAKNRRARVKVLAAFEKKNPDLFSPEATKEEKAAIRQKIGKVANVLSESGMDFKEAVNRAHLTVNPKAAVQKGKDEAYAEGLGERQAGFSSQTSTEGKKAKKTKYSKKELEIADKLDRTGKVKKAMLEEE